MTLEFCSHSMNINSGTNGKRISTIFFSNRLYIYCANRYALCIAVNVTQALSHVPFPSIGLVHGGLGVRASILNTVLVLLVRAQCESARELLPADSARILHLVVRVRKHMVPQIAWKDVNCCIFRWRCVSLTLNRAESISYKFWNKMQISMSKNLCKVESVEELNVTRTKHLKKAKKISQMMLCDSCSVKG